MDKQEYLNLLNLQVIKDYKKIMIDGLRNSFPLLDTTELEEAINWSIVNSYYNAPAKISNNYTKQEINGTVIDVLNYIERLEPIVTSSGVLFKKHKEAPNPLCKMIMGFINQRAVYKKEMFKYPKGSAEFEKFNLLQLLEKLNGNATYGVLGAPSSAFYNIYVAEAVTRQGRSYISCSIMLFESFLANNVKFNSLNEIITFIDNVVNERNERKFDDRIILDRNITHAECFYKLMDTVDFLLWIPTEKEMGLLWERILGLSQEDINRIYYKNNLYTFCELPRINDIILRILGELNIPFMNPNKPPKCIKNDLDILTEIIKEYVYYGFFYIDKLDRIEYMTRDIVIISDTDSTIISFDAWYNYILNKVYNIDLPIKHEKFKLYDIIKADEFGDRPKRLLTEPVEPEYDYNFYTDEVIEIHRLRDMGKIIPQDSLKYSIINIIAYVCTELVVDYLARYCRNAGSEQPGVPCKMVMKNEFYFLSACITSNRRNYADVQVIQEGNVIPDKQSARLAIMGLPINKTTLPDGIKRKLQNILYEDVLTATNIDQVKIMKKLVIIEKEIISSIMNKETIYYKPDNIAAISSYKKNPLSVNGISASLVYNELRTEDMPAINLEERNKIFKIKTNINRNNIDRIKDKYPDIYNKLIRLIEHPTLGSKLDTIAFPVDSQVPDWILEFVDIPTIVNDNLKNFPLESIGLRRLDNDSVNYSNIVSL